MKSYATLRRHPYGQVVPRVNDDRSPLEVVPFGRYGAGVWTGHPAGLIVVLGILLVGLIGIPEWRYFFAASVLAGSAVGYALLRRHGQI
jgi:hypothetical protein